MNALLSALSSRLDTDQPPSGVVVGPGGGVRMLTLNVLKFHLDHWIIFYVNS